MSSGYLYEPLPDVFSGVRLHLNENTDGCSPAVLDAIRALTRQEVGWYPSYTAATEAVAAYFGVSPEQVLLTNGLDEGIITLALALVRRQGPQDEVVVVEPSYGLYGPSAALAGAAVRLAAPAADLSFDEAAFRAVVTPATRLIMLSNPNNPAGHLIQPADVLRMAASLDPSTYFFVDEAYADFAGVSVLPALTAAPNIIVGRTFAKAFGLAGMRIGCLIASPALIRTFRSAIAPFSVNVFAAAALPAALADRAHLAWYLQQVRDAKIVLYEAFDRLGLKYWRSEANFVLVRVGDAPRIRQRLSELGIHVRDRSSAPGCEGCIRMTAGRVEDAQRAVRVLEEVL
jgi:histidinol-phosphate aminotransferase